MESKNGTSKWRQGVRIGGRGSFKFYMFPLWVQKLINFSPPDYVVVHEKGKKMKFFSAVHPVLDKYEERFRAGSLSLSFGYPTWDDKGKEACLKEYFEYVKKHGYS